MIDLLAQVPCAAAWYPTHTCLHSANLCNAEGKPWHSSRYSLKQSRNNFPNWGWQLSSCLSCKVLEIDRVSSRPTTTFCSCATTQRTAIYSPWAINFHGIQVKLNCSWSINCCICLVCKSISSPILVPYDLRSPVNSDGLLFLQTR